MSRHGKPFRFRNLKLDTDYLSYRLDTVVYGLSAAAGFLIVFAVIEHFAPCVL
ncbi:hypothetical protein ACIA8C_07425 [Nocardia sp. NPDC051321]|uniref:hypothetical protein n=1 Tax=unclassified Nocardia TaxID=2637762 RepID=UPI00379EBFE4